MKIIASVVHVIILSIVMSFTVKGKEKPNIVLILTDQWRGQSIGLMNEDQVLTPRLDELAASGVLFRNAYTARAICGPSRACILTGQYPISNGVYGNSVRMSTDSETLGTVSKANGYETAYIGKWHIDGPDEGYVPPKRRSGFDYWIMSNHHQPFNQPYYIQNSRNAVRKPDSWEPDWITDRAIEYIHSKQNDPFMMVLSYGPPHTGGGSGFEDRWQPGKRDKNGEINYGYGYAAPDEYENMYPDPENYPRRPNVEPVGSNNDPSWPVLPGYFGAITSIDYNIGRLIDSLKQYDQFENTIILFTSDHGEMLGSHGRMTKGIWFEESVKIPAILSYPAKVAPLDVSNLFSSIDIFPTLCGLAELDIPSQVQGVDFSKALTGKEMDLPDYLFTSFDMGSPGAADRSWRGVNTERFTFVLAKTASYSESDDIQEDGMVLYDKSIDPYQMHPIYKGMDYDQVMDSLFAILKEHLNNTNDPFLEKQWKAERAPFYQYNDARTRGMIPEQEKLNIGTKPDPSDHLFKAPDLSPFPFAEQIEINKPTFFGELNLTFDASLKSQPDQNLYVSRFQDRLCISQEAASGNSDHRHIDEDEVLKIIIGETEIFNENETHRYDVYLEALSFRQMSGDEISIKNNRAEEVFITSIDTDYDYEYYFNDPMQLIQHDTITIETLKGSWRLNGFILDLIQQDSVINSSNAYRIQSDIHGIPNPCHHKIVIRGLQGDNLIKVFDIHGEVLYSGHQKKLDVSAYKPGIYLVNSGLQTMKFLKVN